MENEKDNNNPDDLIITRINKKRKDEPKKKIYTKLTKYKIINNSQKSEIISKESKENINYFRKKYINNKIRNPSINKTLNDIYCTIKSIHKINNKIYKIFNKKTNSKTANTTNENIKNMSIKSKIINVHKNKSNNKTKGLKRAKYSYDNMMILKRDTFSLKNDDKNSNKQKLNDYSRHIEDKSILYLSSFISEEINKTKINNKLNYEYNNIYLRDKIFNQKNKLKRNQTYENILNIYNYRNSKNIKDIIALEKSKQTEFKKLEKIKMLKQKYFNNDSALKKDFIEINDNKNNWHNKPRYFNDNINIYKNNNIYNNLKNSNYLNYFNKIISNNNAISEHKTQQEYIDDSDSSLINKLNYNYQAYKNILDSKLS